MRLAEDYWKQTFSLIFTELFLQFSLTKHPVISGSACWVERDGVLEKLFDLIFNLQARLVCFLAHQQGPIRSYHRTVSTSFFMES
mmetsp:Transcript_13834/g.25806  ORF Transcript_13834/g.25806 Transcript_13834/m.25806 type:complete len:85 (+) Transcript_13834:69-323(+)